MVLLLSLNCLAPSKDSPAFSSTGTSPDSRSTDSSPDSATQDSGRALPADPCFNEFMADNQNGFSPDGVSHPDWIELYNPGTETIDLQQWVLADGAHKEGVPIASPLALTAGGFLVLVADGLTEAGPAHLGFKLDAAGEDLVLYNPDGRRVAWLSFSSQLADVAAARRVDGSQADGWMYVAGGTPGGPNHP